MMPENLLPRTLGVILAVVTCAGCAIQPENLAALHNPPGIPASFDQGSAKQFQASSQWWQDFQNQELNGLLQQAFNTNFSLAMARARLEQASYGAIKQGAAARPQLALTGSAGPQDSKHKGAASQHSELWQLGATLNYELDLWGRYAATSKEAAQRARASREDLHAAVLSLAGELTAKWLALISNRQQQQLLIRQTDLQKKLLALLRHRFINGRSSALDIYQQQQAILGLEEMLHGLQADGRKKLRELAILIGKNDLAPLTTTSFPKPIPLPDTGLPAALLENRPDVKAAWRRLVAEQWGEAAARADRLPALRLTAGHTYSSDEPGSLFDNWLTNLAANLTAPLLDGNRRKAEVLQRRAMVAEKTAAYSQTVLIAIQEVENALTDADYYAANLQTIHRRLSLARRTVNEARHRYLNGDRDFINVLAEEMNMLQLEQDKIVNTEKLLRARVYLYKALGGSWMSIYAR